MEIGCENPIVALFYRLIILPFVAGIHFAPVTGKIQGPILQFQSTIFQKEDIKKMVETINKASGDAGISEQRLDKAFEVWYPNLEKDLSELKTSSSNTAEAESHEDTHPSAEILEEILELSRDNQKLLRNPDSKLYDEITKMQSHLERICMQNDMLIERRRTPRKYNAMFFDDVMHIAGRRSGYAFLMVLSLLKEDFPWLYDMGKELIDVLKTKSPVSEKQDAIRDFREMADFTFGHPMMRETFGRSKDSVLYMKELPYVIMRYLDELSDKYCEIVR